MPTPSIRARRTPPIIALPAMAGTPEIQKCFHLFSVQIRPLNSFWMPLRLGGLIKSINENAFTISSSQNATSGSTANDGIPWVFLLPEVHQRTIDCTEHATPNGKIAGNDRRSLLYSCKTAHQSSTDAGWCVSIALDCLEHTATDASHCECTTTIVNDAIWTRFSCVFFHDFTLIFSCACSEWTVKMSIGYVRFDWH